MTRAMTPEEIRHAGFAALLRELGPLGMARFLQQFDIGRGDYSTERHAWLDHLTVDDIAEELRKRSLQDDGERSGDRSTE
ncbi:MAG: hypothetical protein ACRDJE_03310 [Dehalococcoidia bacterium]